MFNQMDNLISDFYDDCDSFIEGRREMERAIDCQDNPKQVFRSRPSGSSKVIADDESIFARAFREVKDGN